MVYKCIYDPKGKMFEVTEEKANKLILLHGWTQTKPVVETKIIKSPNKERPRMSRKDFSVYTKKPAIDDVELS